MGRRASLMNYHEACALADALCYQCSELSGPYEIASGHLKVLHSTLEGICAVSHYFPASFNIAALDDIVNECGRFLVAIDRSLEYQDRQPLASNATDVKFTARIQLITKKLLDACRLVILPQEINSFHTVLKEDRLSATASLIASETSCELEGSTCATSKQKSLDSTREGGMATFRANTRPPERSVREYVDGTVQANGQTRRLTSPAFSDNWNAPFALADPMSSDIETASYLILADDEAFPPDAGTPGVSSTPIRESVTASKPRAICQISSLPADNSHIKSASLVSMSTKLHPTVKVDSAYENGSFVTSPSCGRQASNATPNLRPKYRVVNADPTEALEETSDDASMDEMLNEHHESGMPRIPAKNPQRALPRRSLSASWSLAAQSSDWDLAESDCLESRTTSQQSGAPGTDCVAKVSANLDGAIKMEQTERIMKHWNTRDFAQAGLLLEDLLKGTSCSLRLDVDRRARFLIGVATSLDGRWEHALNHFLSVLRTDPLNAALPDEGDCAAAHWMGDLYTLLDRRTEALIAYSLAKQGMEASTPEYTASRQQLTSLYQAEQYACRSGFNKNYFEQQLNEIVQHAGTDSILSSEVMTRDTAQKLFESIQWPPDSTVIIKPNQSRVMALSDLDPKSTEEYGLHGLHLSASAFEPSASWPLPFDPLFAMGNTVCGLPLSSKCDLSQLKKIPRRSGAVTRSRLKCFTCPDSHWLILTLRACMERLELQYTEIANAAGTWMVLQYPSTEEGGSIASIHFASISIFRLTIRSGFGVEICPAGIFSSRISMNNGDESSHAHELKRIRKLIREYLDVALRKQEGLEDAETVGPVMMGINGVASLQRGALSKGEKRRSEPMSSSTATSSRSGSFF